MCVWGGGGGHGTSRPSSLQSPSTSLLTSVHVCSIGLVSAFTITKDYIYHCVLHDLHLFIVKKLKNGGYKTMA